MRIRQSCSEGSGPGSVCTSGSDTTVDHEGWTGALACEDSTGRWVAAPSYHITGGSLEAESLSEASVVASLGKVVEAGLAPRATEDRCEGRCLLGKCVGQDRLCDRVWDCVDGGDERGCNYTSYAGLELCRGAGAACLCAGGHGKCGNNLCLPRHSYCDGRDDCGDGSDERSCEDCAAATAFLSPSKLCDGEEDCHDGGDEAAQFCPGCGPDTFR